MRDYKRIEEITNQLDSFLFTDFVLIVFVIGVLLSACVFLSKNKYLSNAFFIYTPLAILFIIVMDAQASKLKLERETITNSIDIAVFETKTDVDVTEIEVQTPVSEDYCPKFKLKADEKCYYIELADNGGVNQFFMPLKEQLETKKDTPLEIEYMVIPKEYEDKIYTYFDFENELIDGQYKIQENRWAFGLTTKEE